MLRQLLPMTLNCDLLNPISQWSSFCTCPLCSMYENEIQTGCVQHCLGSTHMYKHPLRLIIMNPKLTKNCLPIHKHRPMIIMIDTPQSQILLIHTQTQGTTTTEEIEQFVFKFVNPIKIRPPIKLFGLRPSRDSHRWVTVAECDSFGVPGVSFPPRPPHGNTSGY